MSFQAPSTDTDPIAGFKAPDDDADAPKWSDLPGHILPDAENMLKGGAETALRIGKGVYDLPSDFTETARQELTGGNPLNTPIAQDVKTVGQGVVDSAKAIPGQLKDLVSKDAWIQHPVGNAMTGAALVSPFLGGEEAAARAAVKSPAPIGGSLAEAALKEIPVPRPDEPGWVYDVLGDKKNVGSESAVPVEDVEKTSPAPKFETIEPNAQGPVVVDPANSKAIQASEAQTGKPIKLDLYRGLNPKGPTDPGDWGKGAYHTGEPKIASMYAGKDGQVVKNTIEFKNPLVFDTMEDAIKFRRQLVGDDSYYHKESTAKKIDDFLRSNGYDGVITKDGNAQHTSGIKDTVWEAVKLSDRPTGPEPKVGEEGAPVNPPPKEDPFKDVRDYIASKASKIEAKGGWPERMAGYLKNEATNLGAKDLGLQGRQIQSMGQGFKGLEKAEALVNYAREKGYLDPSLSDVARKQKIVDTMNATAGHLDAIRNVADKRGAPPLDAIKQAVQQELQAKYGSGTEKATGEIANVMDDINKAKPSFSGMSELATKLNKSATKVKDLGQHPGPTTDAANIVSRINNDALRGVLNPKEANLYTQSLRDYGAHKKLEQAVAGSERRNMSARSNQRGVLGRLWQEALDRGGYRVGGNVANKVANTILKNPGKIKTLPQFFEELAHQSDESLDDALGISGMYQGGRVPDDVRKYIGC